MAILSIGELLGMGPDQLSGFVPYSAISGHDNVISSINGSGLSGAGTDTSAVSAIASAYAESAASSKLDNSASSTWYPMTGNPSGFLTSVSFDGYATTEYVDSSVSSKADASSLSAYQPTSAMTSYQSAGDYVYNSAVSSKVDQSAFDNCCSSVSADLSALSSYMTAISGSVSGKMDSSGMSAYALSADVSSCIDTVSTQSATWGQGGGGADYTGIVPVYIDNTGRTIEVSSIQLGVDSSMTSYLSGDAMLFGVNQNFVNVLSSMSAWAINNGWTGV